MSPLCSVAVFDVVPALGKSTLAVDWSSLTVVDMQFSLLNSTRAVAVTSCVVLSVVVLGMLSANRWQPSVFAGFGQQAGENTEYVIETLGPDIVLRSGRGHDGRFFYIQALDPLIADREAYLATLDHPAYRAQRILYPLVAGGLGLLPPKAVVWGMLLVNVLTLAAGTVITASLAQGHGLTPWLGLAFLLNPGLIDELAIGGAGILAAGFLVAAVAAMEKGRWSVAAFLFLGAVLSREVIILAVAAAIAFEWFWHRRVRWMVLVWPVVGAAVWYAYIRWRLGVPERAVGALTPLPFKDLPITVSAWTDSLFALVMGLVVLLGAAYVIWRAAKRPIRTTWVTGSFAFLVPFLTVEVIGDHFNLSRAMAPLFIGIAFAVVDHISTDGAIVSSPRSWRSRQ